MDLNINFDTTDLSPDDLEAVGHEPQPPALAQGPVITRAPKGRTVTRTGADTSRFVYMDIETIPDADRQPLFDEVVCHSEPAISAEMVRKQNVEDIKEFFAEHGDTLPDSYIEQLKAIEQAPTDKPATRSSVLGIIQKLQVRRVKEAEKKPKLFATTPEYCKIISLSIAVGEGEPITLVNGLVPKMPGFNRPVTEKDILEFFWAIAGDYGPIVGYNHTLFDIPAICVRSAIVGVEPTRQINLSPYSNECIDLMVKRFLRSKAMPMKTLTKLYGLPDYGDDCDGSKVAELYVTDPEKVGHYNACDVLRLRDLFHFLSGFFWM